MAGASGGLRSRHGLGTGVTRASIVGTLGQRFAKWQMPDEVSVTDEIPRTSLGKLDKKLLRRMWEGEGDEG